MKKHGMRCELAIAGALLFCTGSSALAQAGPQLEKYRYLTLDYQKTEPGKARDYVQLEKEYYKPLHQERVNLGRIISWRLYAVNFPNGRSSRVRLRCPHGVRMLCRYGLVVRGLDRRKILGESKYAEIGPKTTAARKLLRQDTLAVLLSTENWDKANNKFIEVHFLKSLPGKFDDLLKVQREFYLPQNEDLIKAGHALSWATTAVRYPRNFDGPYNSMSFNGAASLAETEKARPKTGWRSGVRRARSGCRL